MSPVRQGAGGQVRIRFTMLFAERIGGITSVEVTALSVEAALHALTARHPELNPLVWTGGGKINPLMVVFLNDQQLTADELSTIVKDGDEIDIVPALEGGT